MNVLQSLLVFSLLAAANTVQAQSTPEAVVFKTINDVSLLYDRTSEDKRRSGDFSRSVMETIILPNVDLNLMSQLAVGSVVWREASEAERQAFKSRFKERLIKVFTLPISAYNDQPIRRIPDKSTLTQDRASVATQIITEHGAPVSVVYALRYAQRDGWKVYDVTVDGTSMIACYRADFASETQRAGLCGATESLHSDEAPDP